MERESLLRRTGRIFKSGGSNRFIITALLTVFTVFPLPARPASEGEGNDLTEYSIEELMNIDISTLSRKPEKLVSATASVSVITSEDIRRSPATNIPELLNMVTGLQVFQIDENNWNIKAHGFDQSFGGNFLILIDGRKLSSNPANRYVLLVEEFLLDDIERIEIIKGPGAVTWGARAYNGVINVLTKNSRYTQGIFARMSGGVEEKFTGGIRYGGRIGDDSFYRFYLKYMNGEDLTYDSESEIDDDWNFISGGFRMDFNPSVNRSYMIEGSYKSKYITNKYRYPILEPPYSFVSAEEAWIGGGNILFSMVESFSDRSEIETSVSAESWEYDNGEFGDILSTSLSFNLVHQYSRLAGQELVWGFEYGFTGDEIIGNNYTQLTDIDQEVHQFSIFIQDKIEIMKERLQLTLGFKADKELEAGLEILPGARILFTPHTKHHIWGAVSKVLRRPWHFENDFRLNILNFEPGALVPGYPAVVELSGNNGLRNREIISYEVGYRPQFSRRLSIDISGYYHEYRHYLSWSVDAPYPSASGAPHYVVPVHLEDRRHGNAYGIDASVDVSPCDFLKLSGGLYTASLDLELEEGGEENMLPIGEQTPAYQIYLSSSVDITDDLMIDLAAKYTDDLEDSGVDDRYDMDMRLSWHPSGNMSVSITGHNLLEDGYYEFKPMSSFLVASTIDRRIFSTVTFRF